MDTSLFMKQLFELSDRTLANSALYITLALSDNVLCRDYDEEIGPFNIIRGLMYKRQTMNNDE